jgi:hypothetical protein
MAQCFDPCRCELQRAAPIELKDQYQRIVGVNPGADGDVDADVDADADDDGDSTTHPSVSMLHTTDGVWRYARSLAPRHSKSEVWGGRNGTTSS